MSNPTDLVMLLVLAVLAVGLWHGAGSGAGLDDWWSGDGDGGDGGGDGGGGD